MAACTETSSAEVGSSHTTMRGSPAKARAMATRCFSPPESWRGLTARCRSVSRTERTRSLRRASSALPLKPASRFSARLIRCRIECERFSAESGFWKTICIALIWSSLRFASRGASALPFQFDGAAFVRWHQAEQKPGEGRLAAAGFADQPERFAGPQIERHVLDGAQCVGHGWQ